MCTEQTFSFDEVIDILADIGISRKDDNFADELLKRFSPTEGRDKNGEVTTVFVEVEPPPNATNGYDDEEYEGLTSAACWA